MTEKQFIPTRTIMRTYIIIINNNMFMPQHVPVQKYVTAILNFFNGHGENNINYYPLDTST